MPNKIIGYADYQCFDKCKSVGMKAFPCSIFFSRSVRNRKRITQTRFRPYKIVRHSGS